MPKTILVEKFPKKIWKEWLTQRCKCGERSCYSAFNQNRNQHGRHLPHGGQSVPSHPWRHGGVRGQAQCDGFERLLRAAHQRAFAIATEAAPETQPSFYATSNLKSFQMGLLTLNFITETHTLTKKVHRKACLIGGPFNWNLSALPMGSYVGGIWRSSRSFIWVLVKNMRNYTIPKIFQQFLFIFAFMANNECLAEN